MKIIIEAETDEEVQRLDAQRIEYKSIETAIVIAKGMEGGVLQREHSYSFGPDVTWLVGKCYVALETLKQMFWKGA